MYVYVSLWFKFLFEKHVNWERLETERYIKKTRTRNTYVYACNNDKEAINLQENKEVYLGGFGVRNGAIII